MFGAFSKLFKKSEPVAVPTHPTGTQTPPRTSVPLPKGETSLRQAVPRALPGKPSREDCLTIPYSAIIKLIPQELWGKLAPAGVAGYNFAISRATVLEQLPHGAVKASFGELRHNAPSGVFINTPAEDGRMIDLPLSEILSQLHPDSFARRSDQTQIEVSAEVPDLFGAKGERLAPLRVMEKKEVSNTSSFARQNSSTSHTPKPASSGFAAAPSNITPLPTQTPQSPANNGQTAPPIRMSPVQPAFSQPPQSSPPIAFPAPIVPVPAQASVARPLPKAANPNPIRPTSPGIANVASPGFQVGPSESTGVFLIPLDALAATWPDGVRQELAQLKIPDAKVALPSVEICEGLKRGRIQYPWRTLRSWIQPSPIYATPSPQDDVMLELPLRTLTPLFLEFIRANPVNRQSAEAENITEFFRKAEQVSGTSPELLQPLFTPAPLAVPMTPIQLPPTASPMGPSGAAAIAPTQRTSQPAPLPAASIPAAPKVGAEPCIENGLLCLPLPSIAGGWPEPVLRDVAQFGIAGARIEIPLSNVEPGLKSGRLEFAWRELCAWLNPPCRPAQVSINGEVRVTLPLGLIAPLFLKARVPMQRKKLAVAESIPDLFSAAGQPLPQAPVPEPQSPEPVHPQIQAPVPTPALAAAENVAKKTPTNLSELFNEPDKKTWTPNEIVQRTTQLPNVAGALIALQDGLLVASNMPNNSKTETIAAFVPQIFGRLNQYSKELQMGDTKAVSFTVEAGTIQVFNAGIIYFAALGNPGTILPLMELQLIAGELGRHTK